MEKYGTPAAHRRHLVRARLIIAVWQSRRSGTGACSDLAWCYHDGDPQAETEGPKSNVARRSSKRRGSASSWLTARPIPVSRMAMRRGRPGFGALVSALGAFAAIRKMKHGHGKSGIGAARVLVGSQDGGQVREVRTGLGKAHDWPAAKGGHEMRAKIARYLAPSTQPVRRPMPSTPPRRRPKAGSGGIVDIEFGAIRGSAWFAQPHAMLSWNDTLHSGSNGNTKG